jgi:hypothetical protein
VKNKIIFGLFLFAFAECHKLDEFNQPPEITPLTQGFKVSAAIGYCAALANTVFTGGVLPANVTFNKSNQAGYSSSGVIHVKVNSTTPLPFNTHAGDIYIAGVWDNVTGGVISIVFGDFNVIESEFKFYGLYTVPVAKKVGSSTINAVFAQQDIVLGEGSDTLLNLSLSRPKFDTELDRLNEPYPTNVFTAISQNVWFISIDANNTTTTMVDDIYTINGGGQVVAATSTSGGILYHAMLETVFTPGTCSKNPSSGTAFIQNIQSAGNSLDLGNITLKFHATCDGKAGVTVATGKYVSSNGRNIDLNW